MKIEVFSLDPGHLLNFRGRIPTNIFDNSERDGFYTVGAVVNESGEVSLIGLAQFFVDMNRSGECYAELVHIYVFDEYRRKGAGTGLTDKIMSIIGKSGMKKCIAKVPAEGDERLKISPKDLEAFLIESDFLFAKATGTYVRMTDD